MNRDLWLALGAREGGKKSKRKPPPMCIWGKAGERSWEGGG
jgi:hypothetical protein